MHNMNGDFIANIVAKLPEKSDAAIAEYSALLHSRSSYNPDLCCA